MLARPRGADQKAWFNLKRSVDAVLDGKSASAAAQRQQTVLVFDFVAGKFTKRIANASRRAVAEPLEPLAVRLKLQMFVEPEENLTLEELDALDRLEASAKAPVRPRRECSAAAADARARGELELEQAGARLELVLELVMMWDARVGTRRSQDLHVD